MLLPLADPLIKVYPMFANPLSIILNSEHTYGWFLNNFIQICKNKKALNFYDFNYKRCPFIKRQSINVAWIKSRMDVLDFLCTSIENGEYVYLLVNVKNLSSYPDHEDRIHDLFIYGIDREKGLFYIQDYFERKFTQSFCSFQELAEAVSNIYIEYDNLPFKGNLELLSFDHKRKIPFSQKRLIDSLKDYLNGTGTTSWNVLDFDDTYENADWKFGIDIYDYLYESLKKGNPEYIYIQDYHLLCEHKEQLLRNINYLQNTLVDYEILTKEIKVLIQKAYMIRNIVLMCKTKKSYTESERLIKMLMEMKEMEETFIEYWLDELNDY